LSRVANRRAIVAWTLYDFANSPFTTLVVTFVYARYFTEVIASNRIEGTALWGYAITVTALIVAIGSPILGALADQGGYRKRFLLVATAISAGATAILFGVLPGQVLAALLVFIIANVAFEFGTVFYNAYLPDLTTPANIGRVSGWGWGLGYFGGLLALGIALLALVQPETPWFGFSRDADENIRATNLLVAIWFVVFSLPLVFFVHDRKPVVRSRGVVAGAFSQLAGTFREVRRHRETLKFLIARLVYNDGLVTIFAFGGIYAAGTFGFSDTQVLIFGIVINLAAGVGALLMGYVDDWLGAKRTILISLLGLIVASIIGVFAENATWFWVAGVAIGIFSGPNQSASRSLMGRYVPPGMENEFFGFFAFSGKLTAFIGPFLLGLVTGISQSQRVGMTVVIMMFMLGLMLLIAVKDPSQARSLE